MKFTAIPFLSFLLVPTLAFAGQLGDGRKHHTSFPPAPGPFIQAPPTSYIVKIKQLDPEIEFKTVICTKYDFHPSLHTNHERVIEIETRKGNKQKVMISIEFGSGIASFRFHSPEGYFLVRENKNDIYETTMFMNVDLDHPVKASLELFISDPAEKPGDSVARLEIMITPAFVQPHNLTIKLEDIAEDKESA